MKYTIEQLSYVVPAISIGFLFIITSINVYFKIRRRFPATVNCWFCNENSRVPYDDSNKWNCPKCEQYNGFAEDGDYNCDIPAQRSAKLNNWKTSSFSSMNGSISGRLTPTNGLCEPCNRNQELKVQQLASFEPENEAYFDEEIEEYRFKLEQAYRLCPRCERHLKRTLNKVKTNILGSKLRQIGTKGLQAFNLSLNQKANKVIVYRKRLTFARISLGALIVISLLQSFTTTNQINITKPKLDSVFNAATTTSILTVLSYMSALKILIFQFIQYVLDLPYISLAATCGQMLVKYAYTYVSGDVLKSIRMEIFEFVSDDDSELGYSTLTTNISGCFLSIFLLFLFGLSWGPVLSLLLWSLSMILPTITFNATDLRQALIVDSIQLILVWSSASLSLVNFFMLPNKSIQSENDKNASFHRISTEINSDVSDDSEVESELNSSLRSNMSSASKRSLWNETRVLNSTIASKAPSVYSTNSLRQRSYGVSNQSLASTKPTLSDMNTSFNSERFYRGSQLDLSRDRLNASQRSFMTTQSPDIFSRNQCTSAMSFHALNKTFTNAEPSIVRSASRNSFYDIPNDFESGITQLSISGVGTKRTQKQPRAFGSTDLFSDAFSSRKSVLSPSRLSLNETHHSVNQSSWLAGGYWNNSLSPQKNQKSFAPPASVYRFEPCATPKDAFPMISRASSKSSGFESRENSLCDDTEVERTFLLPEPSTLTQATKASNGLIKPQPHKPMSLFNGFIGDNCQQQQASGIPTPTSDVFNHSNSELETTSPNFSLLSRSFGRFTLQQPQTHIQDQNNILKSDQSITSTLNQFVRHKELPMRTFQRGSLIRLNGQTSMDH